jgi:hypothetical protein
VIRYVNNAQLYRQIALLATLDIFYQEGLVQSVMQDLILLARNAQPQSVQVVIQL